MPALLYVVTEDWYFLSHRLPMARAARAAGYDVHVACAVADGRAAIEAEGFTLHALPWRRRALSPLAIMRDIAMLHALYRRLAPDLIHHVALKPAIAGSLAALGLLKPRIINSVAGLGFVFTSATPKARLMRGPFGLILRLLLNRRTSTTIVQNPDDMAALEALGIAPERLVLVPGSGVDADRLTPLPEPDGPVRAAYVGRMLEDKGLRALIEAHRLLRGRGVEIGLDLAGAPDPDNPTSIPEAELRSWASEPGVRWLGHVRDIRQVWADAHIAVLPSRREGLPKSLLEAAACGRPIVATDVPGCREVARAGVNALLVPMDDAEKLAEALKTLAYNKEMRTRFGAAGRELVETIFASDRIGAATVAVYERLLRM